MSRTPASPTKAPAKPDARPGSQPPEERFWRRYSAHHEFPLSSVSSVVIHCLMGLALILIGLAVINAHEEPLPIDTVSVEGGGGGSPDGEGNGPGNGVPPPPSYEVAAKTQESKVVAAPHDEPKNELPDLHVNPPQLPDRADQRPIEPDTGAFREITGRSESLKNKLLEGLRQGKGKGGSGSGGGQGNGVGTGEGSGIGPGNGKVSVRQKRLLRWTLIFNTTTGEDYRRQLVALGAILAIPQPKGGYMVIRDLRRLPAHGEVEDLDKINRIFWIDEKPDSVGALAGALGIRPRPPHIVAFFPQELEDQLLRKELDYHHRSEDEIRETRFEVRQDGGRYVPEVLDQTTN